MMRNAILRQWKFSAPILDVVCNRRGDFMAVPLGDGSVQVLPASDSADAPKEIIAHDGVSLCLTVDADDHAFLSGGDDGQVLIIDPSMGVATSIAHHAGQWIDHVAGAEDGVRAYSLGKEVVILDDAGAVKSSAGLPSSVGGLAFSPNGKRLAGAHYNGLSLFWVQSKDAPPVTLEWKGSHFKPMWQPEGKMVVTSMQEAALHGWRLADMAEMRMEGYAAKIHSLAYTAGGKYLATSGAAQVICWPFFGGGPWGKKPLMLGADENRLVTRVAPHPTEALVAAGYDDGMVIMSPLDGRVEMIIAPPSGCAVVGLTWNADGDCLFAGYADGTLALFTAESVRKMVNPA